jgi:hypothetical protein
MAAASKTFFPTIKQIASELVYVKRHYCESGQDGWVDVRLQVMEGGKWAVRFGDSSYDQDRRGY